MNENSKTNYMVERISYIIILAFHAVSALYIAFKLIFMPDSIETDAQKSNMRLMVLQCVLACVVIHAPLVVRKLFKMPIPTFLCLMFWVFLFCGVFLGEVASFYYIVPHWDDFLHFLSSLMTGLLGYMVFSMFIKDKSNPGVSPAAAVVFAFCFSVAIGAIWEIYEYTCDGIMQLNMQKYAFEDATEKIGRLALFDTMKDIIVDVCGASISTIYGCVSLKLKRGFIYKYFCSEEQAVQINEQPALQTINTEENEQLPAQNNMQ